MEHTLIVIKPEGLRRGLVGEIITRFEKKGFCIRNCMRMHPSETHYIHHYEHLKNLPFFGELITHMTSGPVIAMVLEGDHAIAESRKMIGATDPTKSDPGTIRGDYALLTSHNLIHGSDSEASAKREIDLWFPCSHK